MYIPATVNASITLPATDSVQATELHTESATYVCTHCATWPFHQLEGPPPYVYHDTHSVIYYIIETNISGWYLIYLVFWIFDIVSCLLLVNCNLDSYPLSQKLCCGLATSNGNLSIVWLLLVCLLPCRVSQSQLLTGLPLPG